MNKYFLKLSVKAIVKEQLVDRNKRFEYFLLEIKCRLGPGIQWLNLFVDVK